MAENPYLDIQMEHIGLYPYAPANHKRKVIASYSIVCDYFIRNGRSRFAARLLFLLYRIYYILSSYFFIIRKNIFPTAR